MAEIKIGQVWADNDPRAAGRTLRVDRIERVRGNARGNKGGMIVTCTVLTDGIKNAAYRAKEGLPGPVGRTTKINASRFRPTMTGYRLLKESADAAADPT